MTTSEDNRIRFKAGTIVATVGATMIATEDQIRALVARHLRGDWGDVCPEDAKANEAALKWGKRVMSSYKIGEDRLWVLTEADRASTCVLTPGEY